MAIRFSIPEVMSGLHVAFFAALFFTLVLDGYEQDLELDSQQNIINKHAVKTIKTEYGDVIDCVDIYKQPAFDHPLLKNHIIQRRPSYVPSVVKKEALSQIKPVNFHHSNGCPSGSVPIRRTSADKIGSKRSNIFDNSGSRPHYSLVLVHGWPGEPMYGAGADIDAYNPVVESGQSTGAQIWVQGGPTSHVNSIEVGWLVDPYVYGDKRTHLFTYWTANGYANSGCYDMRCPGFVQIDKTVTLGGAFPNTSTINGDQYALFTLIYQDQTTKNWWLEVDKRFVGYWPKELFRYFSQGAELLLYGGRARSLPNQPSPPMGSGLKPDQTIGSFTHVCFFAQVKWVNLTKHLDDIKGEFTKAANDKSGCYGLDNHGFNGNMGYTILFGGPGGQCNG